MLVLRRMASVEEGLAVHVRQLPRMRLEDTRQYACNGRMGRVADVLRPRGHPLRIEDLAEAAASPPVPIALLKLTPERASSSNAMREAVPFTTVHLPWSMLYHRRADALGSRSTHSIAPPRRR